MGSITSCQDHNVGAPLRPRQLVRIDTNIHTGFLKRTMSFDALKNVGRKTSRMVGDALKISQT